MDNVRVHYNSSKPAQLNAHAYAQGTEIHVAPGQERHLPHEAWHVTQQAQGRVTPTAQLAGVVINDNSALEREADVMGARAQGLGPFLSPGRNLQRQRRLGGSNILQGRFVLSKKRRTPIDDDTLKTIGMYLRGHPLYPEFKNLSDSVKTFRLLGWLNENRDALGELHGVLYAIAEGEASEPAEESDQGITFIADEHYDAPGSDAGPLKYLTDKRSELIPWLFNGNRVKMQQTSGRIRGSAKKEDWSAVRVTLGEVLLLHKIDGPAAEKSKQRELVILQRLSQTYPSRKARSQAGQSKKKGRGKRQAKLQSQQPPPLRISMDKIPSDVFSFAFQKAVFGEANIKIAIDPQGRKISLDGVGRVRAMLSALARLKLEPDNFTIDAMAMRVTPEEYDELEAIHKVYYDESGQQREKEGSLGWTPGIVRTLTAPIGKLAAWLQSGTKKERDLGKALSNDEPRFFRNNCLIVAIADAAGIPQPSAQQIIQIRTQISQPVGGMLLATPQAINVIRQVTGITRTIRITYTHLLGTAFANETFAGGTGLPLIVHHAHNHFYHPPGGVHDPKSLDQRARASVGLMGTSSMSDKELNLAIKPYAKLYRERFDKELHQTMASKGYDALNWLHQILDKGQFQEMCKGGQIRVAFSRDLYEGLRRMRAEPRKSSHYSGIIIPTQLTQVPDEHYGIDGDFFPTVLFGLMENTSSKERFIYIQAERNSYNPSASKFEKLHHILDASDYSWSQQNQGPYGISDHTDADPMGDTRLDRPGWSQRWHLRRVKAMALMLLKPYLAVPAMLNLLPTDIKRALPTLVMAVLLHLMQPTMGQDSV
ncbi:uncharacterized protein DUF4157 [Roseateles asaccharophilus]|uniref:Uncharacterized protein DUF4157 n=2 Tax=Roseateles asaccharophilus TaxID=582607 RepID=A0A4R6N8P1_9BURK|nr:uncharacterized protein DUF4157 [Roseateles asaccharophilus]